LHAAKAASKSFFAWPGYGSALTFVTGQKANGFFSRRPVVFRKATIFESFA
jgi:hypothetical protein